MTKLLITEDCILHTLHDDVSNELELLQQIIHPCEGETKDETKNIEFVVTNKLVDDGFENSSVDYFIDVDDINFKLKADGKYTYYRASVYDSKYIDKLISQGQLVRYPDNIYYLKGNKLYINNHEVDPLDLLDDIIVAVDNVGIISFERKDIFSICKLNNCILRLQKKQLLDNIGNCSKGLCSKNNMESESLKLLFITLYILEHLIHLERYEEAQAILNDVSGSCGNICDNGNNDNPLFSSCGCDK